MSSREHEVPISIKIGRNVKLSRTYHIRPENANTYHFVSKYFTKITENLKIKFFWNFGPKYDCGGMNMVFGQRFVFFCPFISTCSRISWYVVEFCSPFVDFQSCFDLVFLGFVNFCQFLLDLVEFGWLAFHFLVFWRFVFVLVAFGLASVNSRQGFPLFSVSAEFVADFIHVLSGVLSIFPNLHDCRRFC